MIEKGFRDFDHTSDEGKMLLAAIAILTSINQEDIAQCRYGGMICPEEAMEKVRDLANKIYHEKEWKINQIIEERIQKIDKIEDE